LNIPEYARYDYCYRRSYDFLRKYEIKSYPIDPLWIIHKEKYGLITYSELMSMHHCSLEDVKKCLSNDGYTTLEFVDGKEVYSIAYNDQSESAERIRFTLMHELGHIYLRHLTNFENTQVSHTAISSAEYNVLEREANAFARNVLAPTSLIMHMKNRQPKDISATFGLSIQAAEARLDFLELDIDHFDHLGLKKEMQELLQNCDTSAIIAGT